MDTLAPLIFCVFMLIYMKMMMPDWWKDPLR